MVEHEESLDEYIEHIVRNENVEYVIETLGVKEYVKSHKEISEEVEKLIYERVEKYVTEEGFPNKGINKEDIIRKIVNFFFEKTIAPVTEQRETTHDFLVDFLKNYKALVTHRKGAKMQAEELSNTEIKKIYEEITAEEKEKKNE